MGGWGGIGIRLGTVAAALAAWFGTQRLLGRRPSPGEAAPDVLHRWSAPLHGALVARPRAADRLLVVSSAFVDALGLYVLGAGLLGPSFRPLVALFAVFSLRQVCQALVVLPAPQGMIWRDPGFPTLFVTYGTGGDFFFSGHTAIAALGALELSRAAPPWLAWTAAAVALLEVAAVIVLRAHWTIDVLAGALVAAGGEALASRIAPAIDAWLGLA
jgi:membrane-associated phospholipid phosphatase